ncbi:NADH-quinone oxidoreductase subunit NuoG [Devosia sp. 63-57]|uniref:NADH-quinone oxidoreductase subunit NuoG n=1 Tax=Devosia sp. 63-57 TaxID=1895751 RepID=UPI00086999FC|nr:NADH-quinone oxidoreductase subunit NuoG [Devosia sp. 63-57]ODT50233.1 MAG: NADH-quinone oxidoreductase subunit G [Pelagibacterium sp. SCN 63-126]ODU80963.1 MAG: NADH-quinone oxidoreductase subunit G [Pelagibacterium sp. SCN 63-17]OJX44977.1 MAG: NADH-quinone oxidoreductase subunit G [Devosia sp. 63-57]
MASIKVDGQLVEVPDYYTLMQAAEAAGAEIPRFCYHERLSVAGNCRMCLVEVKGGPPKPQASCAMSVKDLRPGPNGEPPEMFTNTPMVKKAREGVMEFLLINHPLDCPICDQGGECDLQDQAMAYGVSGSRFHENKRAVEDKYMGALIKTSMNRCIHCTRCVRFTTEVAGISELGLLGRGEDAEITPYLERALTSELQGNVIDLCPVGALTSKPYAFHARPWELNKTESIDVMDAVGSAIRVDSRGREVMRILPRINEAINEEWISDKTRFVWDGLKSQRLDRPYVRKGGKLQPASWDEALSAVAARIKKAGNKVGAIAGDLSAVEEMYALKALLTSIGSGMTDVRPAMSGIDPSMPRSAYLFNPTIAGIEEADAILIIGSNPRREAAVLNARIRKTWRAKNVPIAVIGEQADLTYSYQYLGEGFESLAELAAGKGSFAEVLSKAQRPLVIVGEGAVSNAQLGKQVGRDVIALASKLATGSTVAEGWNGFAMLHNAASRVGGMDIGFVPHAGGVCSADQIALAGKGELDVLFLLGADEYDTSAMGKAFVVYIGSHGDRGAHRADVILPGAAYTEKSGTYVNTEGRVQVTSRAVFPPGDAKEDWAIIRALSGALGKPLAFNSLTQLRAAIYAEFPHLARVDQVAPGSVGDVAKLAKAAIKTKSAAFASPVTDFYLSNPIARASATMAECAQLATGLQQAAE